MSPSRGLTIFLRTRTRIRHNVFPNTYKRSISTGSLNTPFIQRATSPTTRTNTQIYISQSKNPYVNLSIEHYLLQNTHADSTILFLYINRPCVVIGRNQNPWVEVNLGLLQDGPIKPDLVRRRSGGGTVFHDEGNVNYSVICPTAKFDRDIHAEMVVRALRRLGVESVRVNERHDIVMDPDQNDQGPVKKISGSAYKLTRLRSLHHGTCLIRSPLLQYIRDSLRSPAKPYITARGVDSVPSPIRNVGSLSTDEFTRAVVEEFQEMYGEDREPFYVGDKERKIPDIKKGIDELKSKEWIYGQTPQFTFDITRTNTTHNPFSTTFIARNMKLTDFTFTLNGLDIPPELSQTITSSTLASPQRFYSINWTDHLLSHAPPNQPTKNHIFSPHARIRPCNTLDSMLSKNSRDGGMFHASAISKTQQNDNEFQISEMKRVSEEQEMERETLMHDQEQEHEQGQEHEFLKTQEDIDDEEPDFPETEEGTFDEEAELQRIHKERDKELQRLQDEEKRMQNAFRNVFGSGYQDAEAEAEPHVAGTWQQGQNDSSVIIVQTDNRSRRTSRPKPKPINTQEIRDVFLKEEEEAASNSSAPKSPVKWGRKPEDAAAREKEERRGLRGLFGGKRG
ncbi:putative lipoate-protein ligase A [Lachnellula arida]|uniref:Putative lipoate-protein ligase A n=1 Tax=Lachnellula arida TaxID=1316785 RepID=A0A8T9BD01_9HELO|nr:putative lipoate-protein ligase A [Lachnellula arida]